MKKRSENRSCICCNQKLQTRHQIKFCSNLCQSKYYYNLFINAWRDGSIDGGTGVYTRTFSAHIRRYLLEKFSNKCSVCKWDKKNPVSNLVPLEVDHIDGDSENNKESNLRLLCPNCHSLTPHFKNMNKGKGRKWRMKKYIKNV